MSDVPITARELTAKFADLHLYLAARFDAQALALKLAETSTTTRLNHLENEIKPLTETRQRDIGLVGIGITAGAIIAAALLWLMN